MRNTPNNNKRMRGRNNNPSNNSHSSNNNNNNNNRRGQNPMTRVFESNGPDIKIRGTAAHVAEKYLQLARDSHSSGDPVAAENYYQHAEHYFRMIATAQEQFRQNQPQHQTRSDNESRDDNSDDSDAENFSNFGAEPGFAPQPQQTQTSFQPREPREQQSYQRDGNQRDNSQRDGNRDQGNRDQGNREQGNRELNSRDQNYRDQPQRDNYQPPRDAYQQPQRDTYQQPAREQNPREQNYRDNRPPAPAQEQNGVVADDVDRLPSFITGPAQPPVNGAAGYDSNAQAHDRFTPRRRRRPHAPRLPDAQGGPAAPGDDFNRGD